MAQNKNALIRYKTIDSCLQNRFWTWTLEDLIQACSDALYEYEGKDCSVSKRTVQLDIQLMRSDKLGYNAPIVVQNKKYYTYADENYSITNIPLSGNDMDILSESVEILRQFKDFSLFSELRGIIQKLEDKVQSQHSPRSTVIHLDKNEQLKGLEHLDFLYQSIVKEICLNIKYQSFKAHNPSIIPFHPYILKEFNNRWFLIGRKHKEQAILTLALDRMIEITPNPGIAFKKEDFDGDAYYRDTIGVTVLPTQRARLVALKIDRSNAPYVLTKPFHHSQETLERHTDGSVTVQIRVHLNFELERLILGFGESIQVLKPSLLRKRIRRKLQQALDLYLEVE